MENQLDYLKREIQINKNLCEIVQSANEKAYYRGKIKAYCEMYFKLSGKVESMQ
jgi:hypothetical protein